MQRTERLNLLSHHNRKVHVQILPFTYLASYLFLEGKLRDLFRFALVSSDNILFQIFKDRKKILKVVIFYTIIDKLVIEIWENRIPAYSTSLSETVLEFREKNKKIWWDSMGLIS